MVALFRSGKDTFFHFFLVLLKCLDKTFRKVSIFLYELWGETLKKPEYVVGYQRLSISVRPAAYTEDRNGDPG